MDRLQERIDCLSIVALPANYRKALEGAKHTWASLTADLLETTHDPVAQLEKLDDMLSAVGMRLIIFLEDLDRNNSDEAIRDEMPALLDRLRRLSHVSFILAIGTDHQYSRILTSEYVIIWKRLPA